MTLGLRPARAGVRRGFSRLSDRLGAAADIAIRMTTAESSGTWVSPGDGVIDVYLWGAAGGPGAANGQLPGVGGATKKLSVPVTKGVSIPYTVGIGGAPNSIGPGGNNGAGGQGGTSSVSLPGGITLTATGGSGGGSARVHGVGTGGDENKSGSANAPSSVQFASLPGVYRIAGRNAYDTAAQPGGYYTPSERGDGFGSLSGTEAYPNVGSRTGFAGSNGAIIFIFAGAIS